MDIPSLFMIPSAVSSGKVHSVFPNSTDADFDFDRNSDATRVNSDGLIERVGYYGSEEVSNGDFSQSGTVTSTSWTLGWQSADTGASISDGLLTIERTTATVRVYATNNVNSFIGLTSGKKYKLTYTIVSNSNNALLDYHNGGSYVTAPNSEGTHTIDYTTAGTIFLFRNNTNNTTIKIDNVSIKEVTGDRARLNYEIEGGLVNTKPSLLLEPQSTNLIKYSEDFTQSEWTKANTSINSNNITAPDGTQTADKFIENTSSAQHTIYDNVAWTTGQDYSFSVFAKKGERNILAIVFPYTAFGAWKYASFNLDTGATITVDSGVTASIESLPNGWYRCMATATTNATTSADMAIKMQTVGISQGESYQGDGSSGFYIWGAQLEQLSYATSYIPTNGSTQTRAAETCNGAGTSSIFESTEGILYCEIAALKNEGAYETFSLSSGSSSNVVTLFYTPSNGINARVSVGGALQFNFIYTSSNITNFHKFAIKWRVNDFALWVDGTEVNTDTSGSVFSAGTLNELAFDNGAGGEDFYGKIRDIRVYNTKEMTDSEVDILLTKITS